MGRLSSYYICLSSYHCVLIFSVSVSDAKRALENEFVSLLEAFCNQKWKGDPPKVPLKTVFVSNRPTGQSNVGQTKHLVSKPMEILVKPLREIGIDVVN